MKQYMKAGHGNGTFLCVMRLNSQSATELKTTYIIYSWKHFCEPLSYIFLVSVSVKIYNRIHYKENQLFCE